MPNQPNNLHLQLINQAAQTLGRTINVLVPHVSPELANQFPNLRLVASDYVHPLSYPSPRYDTRYGDPAVPLIASGKNLQSMNQRELTKSETSIFVALQLAPNVDGMFDEMAGEPGGWVLKAIEKRFSAHEVETDKKVMIMVLSLGDGIVGRCAKYVDDIVSKAIDCNTQADWKAFVEKIYPHGIPVF